MNIVMGNSSSHPGNAGEFENRTNAATNLLHEPKTTSEAPSGVEALRSKGEAAREKHEAAGRRASERPKPRCETRPTSRYLLP